MDRCALNGNRHTDIIERAIMRERTSFFRLMTVSLAAMMALAISACGSNGSSDDDGNPGGGGGGGNSEACTAADPTKTYNTCVRRTRFGIPHIKADNFGSLAYGYAYAFAQDNLCVIADSYVTVNAQRSRFFGPDAGYVFQGNGAAVNNLNSDFLFQQIIDDGRIEALLTQEPPLGPRPEIKEGVKGYVAGYNRYLRDVGVANLPDASCRGKPWVRPITEMDVYRRFYQLALLASSGVAIDGIGSAQPPATSAPSGTQSANSTQTEPEQAARLLKDRYQALAIGSNAVALGKDATSNGHGMLLGNPHFPWQGSERFYQAHLTMPATVGRPAIDVAGASLFGVPLILIGYTDSMAWSHTVSTAFRFTPYELTLVPGIPTSYLVDGMPEAMTARVVSVQALKTDGTLETRTRTLYSTRYGPMLTSILGLPIFPWTPVRAFALADANASNFRYVNHFFEMNQAKNSREALEILERNQGIPWVNTIVADKAGEALYADISVTPNVSNSKAQTCNTELGIATFQLLGLPVLDGSRTACAWDNDADALQPGTFGPDNMPHLFRDDYVTNSNDSYWLSNPEEPLTGFARIIGDENATRTLRTRLGLVMVREQLANGGKFTRQALQDMVFNNRQYAGELWRDALVGLCQQLPGGLELSSSGPVVVSEACPALADWDLHDDLDSNGAILFRRFASRLLGVLPVGPGDILTPVADQLVFSTPFDANNAVDTPSGLNILSPLVHLALGDAVNDLTGAGIPLTAPLRGFQFEKRGDEKIPIHGGPGTVGVFNAINVGWQPPEGYPDVSHGSSYVQVVSFTDSACPDVRTILTYSQSTNPASPHYADQTRLYSNKTWVQPPFCEADITADPALTVLELRE
jgi:acyl-homoserine-lactone acylase